MYPLLVENMTDEEGYIQNLNIEVNSKEVCYFMCGEKFGRILFEIFCGYKKPKTGEIFVCNKDWLDLDENSRSLLNRRLFGIAAEEFPLIEFMTIEENISMPSLLDGDKSNIEELVKAFDIGHLLQKYPSDLNHREKNEMYLCACLFRRQEGCCDIRFIQKNARAEQGRTCNTYLSCSKKFGNICSLHK